jgi:hypothetical protein
MTELTKSNIGLQTLEQELEKNDLDIKVGDFIICDRGEIYEVGKVQLVIKERWASNDSDDRKKVKYEEVDIEYGNWYEEKGKRKWGHYGTSNIDEFKRRYVKLQVSPEELKRQAIESLTQEEKTDEYDSLNNETALMHIGSKEHLNVMISDINRKKELMEAKSRMLHGIMEEKVSALRKITDEFRNKVKKIEGVIYTIELYLGINEQVVLLQDGLRASATDPICFRQEVMYMDEEVGDPEDDGIDFQNIGDFDAWLLKGKNYTKVIPETKGVVILRVRRDKKHYSDNPYVNSILNQDNMKTYILIRNGDRICRIWADIEIHPRLFPLHNEFAELLQKQKKEYKHDKEEAEEHIMNYRRQMIMLQGMIDRTELFHPLPEQEIKLSDPACHDAGLVRYIYDAEIKLPDGRLTFREWQKKINYTITEGCRIIHSGRNSDSRRDSQDRFIVYYNEHSVPDLPDSGIYQVYKHTRAETKKGTIPHYYADELEAKGLLIKRGKMVDYFGKGYHTYETNIQPENPDTEIKTHFTGNSEYLDAYECEYKIENLIIKYNPGGTVYKNWGMESNDRKNNVSFIIHKRDSFLLNIDEVSLEDVEFYLNSRVNRRDYLSMMPCLYTVKQIRLKEQEFEKDFVSMMVGQLIGSASKKGMTQDKLESIILENIQWWKLKNKWKRGIDKDDAKALRMIKSRTEKQIQSFKK